MATSNTYRGVFPVVRQVRDARVYIGVHLAQVNDRLTCVGLDIRSLNLGDSMLTIPFDLGNSTWEEVGTTVLRGLPLRDVLDDALEQYRELVEGANTRARELIGDGHSSAQASAESRRRGRPPQLGDEVLEQVVAAAYRLGGHRPVQAVQEALEGAGALPSPVSIDQARKAVFRARARGFIPPVRTPDTHPEDHS
ncbi:hypothetical protein ACI79J_04230 [Geodermatophilus sp. SYSU D01062]